MDWVPAHFSCGQSTVWPIDGSKQYQSIQIQQETGWAPWNGISLNSLRLRQRQCVNILLVTRFTWLQNFHIRRLRVDAVCLYVCIWITHGKMLRMVYPNKDGGNHNYEAIDFFTSIFKMRPCNLNHPHCLYYGPEEVPARFPGVSKPHT